MIEAFASQYGIVVKDETNWILVTEESMKRTYPLHLNGRPQYTHPRLEFAVHKNEQLAAADMEAITDTIVFNNKYKQGEEYTGKQLTDYPLEGMIIKRVDHHLPFAYVDGEWTLGYSNVTLMQDGQYQTLYVPEDN